MANITRFDPFSSNLDDLFKGFWVRPMRFDLEGMQGMQQLQMKIDVKKSDGAYTVCAELPGVKKEDIQVNVDGNVVSISAEVKKESEDKKGEQVLRSERYYGKVYRAFSLAQEVDQESAKAKYENGVLELTLPKRAATATRKLAVQ